MLTDMLCICFHYDRYLNLKKKFHTGIVDSIRKENKFMKSVISIGNQDFGSIRENGYFYRPRRFGKTLNMSMLEYFFSNQYAGYSRYFEGLQIGNCREAILLFLSALLQ